MRQFSRRNLLKAAAAAYAAQATRSLFAAGGPMAIMPSQPSLADFAVNSFQQLATAGPDKNVFFSPLSIVEALGMLQAGARGQTADELTKAIGVSQRQLPDVIARI